jgi:hypothetical protein
LRSDLGKFRLAHTSRSLDEDWLTHLVGEKGDGGDLAVANVLLCREVVDGLID